jgi:hypothetical protein
VAVALTGSWTNIQNNSSGNQSQSITVPADADLCVVYAAGYSSGVSHLFSELSLSAADALHFTNIGTAAYSSDPQCDAWYIDANDANWPGTGTQTLYWQWDSPSGEGLNIQVGFFKGVDLSDPIGDVEVYSPDTATPYTYTTSLTGVAADDMGIAGAYSYNQTPDADPAGYGQTAQETFYNHAGLGIGYENGEGAVRLENLYYVQLVAFAINASSGGGTTAVPVFVHHYRIAGGL